MLFTTAFFIAIVGISMMPNWVLLWPGTLAHELNHWLAGVIVDAVPQSFTVLPKGDGVLGEVTFLGLSGWNALPVALAPLTSIAIIWLSWSWLQEIETPWLAGVMGWITASVLIQSWPSRHDFSLIRQYWLGSLAWVTVIIGAVTAI